MKQFLAIVAFLSSIAFGVIAMNTPPYAEIDSSVLWFIAQMLLFTASLIGIDIKIIPFKDVFKTDSHSQSSEDL